MGADHARNKQVAPSTLGVTSLYTRVFLERCSSALQNFVILNVSSVRTTECSRTSCFEEHRYENRNRFVLQVMLDL